MENILMISANYLCDIIPDVSKTGFWQKNQIILCSNRNHYYMSYKEVLIQYYSELECIHILNFLHDSFVNIILNEYTDIQYIEYYKKMAIDDTIQKCYFINN